MQQITAGVKQNFKVAIAIRQLAAAYPRHHCFGCLNGAGVTIGENPIIGMGSVIVKDIPANGVALETRVVSSGL